METWELGTATSIQETSPLLLKISRRLFIIQFKKKKEILTHQEYKLYFSYA